MLLKILTGLVGLGLVVFIHELGHFIAARLSGIQVEAFSIGWGNPIWARKFGGVEYRIGSLPIGGYCKMRGETEFQDALTHRKSAIPREAGTFYGSSPWKRIIVAFSGPAANALFAVLVLSAVWGCGQEIRTLGNRIVLAPVADGASSSPAADAGFQTGDFIVEIEGTEVSNYQEIVEAIAPNAGKALAVTVERDGRRLPLTVTPKLDPSSGAGRIGVSFWIDPVVASVSEGSAAAIGGLRAGDKIAAVNGAPVERVDQIMEALIPSRPSVVSMEVLRGGFPQSVELVLSWRDDGGVETGITYETLTVNTPALSVGAALQKGSAEAFKTFALSLQSLSLLFRGVDLTKAVSGPVRITLMVGDIAADGFGQGVGAGISAVAAFLALLSIALFIMNLLPIPALDGGLIVLFLIEGILRKPLHPKFLYYFQLVGTTIIFGLLLFSLFGDILFLFGR